MRNETAVKKYSFWKQILRGLFRKKPLGTAGLFIIIILLLTGIFADLIAPYDYLEMDLKHKLEGSTAQHLLGTDHLGRDVLSKIIYGARISMIVGVSSALLMSFVAIMIGTTSGLIGGRFDLGLQRFVDAFLCIPGILILMISMSIAGKGLIQMIIVISIPMGIANSRIIRSSVISVKENVYIETSRMLGASTMRVLIHHIIPNIAPVIIILAAMQIGAIIMLESSLSFLGLGVEPGVPSWGSMLSQEGRTYMQIAPSLAIYPGMALAIVVFGANMFGDALRDLLDPQLKGGTGSFTMGRKTGFISKYLGIFKKAESKV